MKEAFEVKQCREMPQKVLWRKYEQLVDNISSVYIHFLHCSLDLSRSVLQCCTVEDRAWEFFLFCLYANAFLEKFQYVITEWSGTSHQKHMEYELLATVGPVPGAVYL